MLSLTDIENAHKRIKPFIHNTPILSSQKLNEYLGHNIYFKAECLQKVGAFKARGGANTLLWLKEQGHDIKRVVANSSGNHAQAVAWAASQLGIPATIYMPTNVSKVKAQATAAYGAEVVYCENRQEADRKVAEAQEQPGVFWIPPFNHEQVVCGQGTAAYEAILELRAQGIDTIDAAFAPCGGGGAISGTHIATKGLCPEAKVIAAEPLAGNDAAQSLRCGEIVTLDQQPNTLADGAMTLAVGEITFDYLKKLDGMIEVDEPEIAYWTQWLSHLLKLHVEPTSAMTMEAVKRYLSDKTEKQNVLVILTGGNVDNGKMKAIWEEDYLSQVPSL
ncbi:serine/threonine dehydratase [Paraferrimonas sedimenticola]|uniref:Serine/threonine dehydratase n=1 Tax=Paraferrimonas sedimenticola TaxID=375674 RepID=A0AA37VWR6_9GAMM|nr:serine/threonine dehydratase [Paraferrimonas sedimenticola]GLP96354.1 serine/threonine dehydratase [Paraferrimonas sedimenticola]